MSGQQFTPPWGEDPPRQPTPPPTQPPQVQQPSPPLGAGGPAYPPPPSWPGGPYPYPPGSGYGPPALQNGMGVASFVLGLVGLLGFLCCQVLAICSVVAIPLGVQGRRLAQQGRASNSGLATAGIVLGIVGTVVAVVGVVAFGFLSLRSG